ncbi:MAG: hypothetical protein PHS54_00075 [Clostridia bacterium]|nr:hypothetical protein [Clostridia bacterium]
MELQDEKKETVYRYKLDCTKEEEDMLCRIARRRFIKDRQAQLEYAVRSILSEMIDVVTSKNISEDGSKNEST